MGEERELGESEGEKRRKGHEKMGRLNQRKNRGGQDERYHKRK